MIEVFIEMAQHNEVPAMVQVFINANTGKRVDAKELINYALLGVFTDSCGRQVMVFKKLI